MNQSLIKICGVQSAAIAEAAVLLGAGFIGMVFHRGSKRFVNPANAKLIVNKVKQAGGVPVAIFTEHTASEMQAICKLLEIDCVQLHGNISRAEQHLLPAHFQRIYVYQLLADDKHFKSSDAFYGADCERDFLLFDHACPGKGKTFNWHAFEYGGHFRWFLAGGLTAQNVARAIYQLRPMGVDVSSGVENEQGQKDRFKIQSFIKAVQYAS